MPPTARRSSALEGMLFKHYPGQQQADLKVRIPAFLDIGLAQERAAP